MAKKKRLFDEDGNEVIKKPIYKRWWFILIAGIFIISAIIGGNDDSSPETTDNDTEEVVEVKEKEAKEEIEEITENAEEAEEELEVANLTEEEELKFEEDFMITLSEDMAIEHFEGLAEVHYSEKENAMVFLPIDEDFTIALAMIEAGLLDKSEWNVLRDSFVEYSGILSEFTGDENILVYVANPANSDKYILIAKNGQIIYDVFNE